MTILAEIDGPYLRRQRLLLLSLLNEADAVAVRRPTNDNVTKAELLSGLVNLLDAVADEAHDRHDIDCLLDSEACECKWTDSFCPVHNGTGCETEEPA